MKQAQAPPQILTGTIKTLVTERGFGFILADGLEYFFHRSAAPDFETLNRGASVTFRPTLGSKGPRAESVTRVD